MKISALPTASDLQDADDIVLVQGGATKRGSVGRLRAAASVITAVASTSGNAIVAASVGTPPISDYVFNREYVVKLPATGFVFPTAAVLTIKIDTAPARELYDETNNLIDLTMIGPGAWLRVRYVPAGGSGQFQIVERRLPPVPIVANSSSTGATIVANLAGGFALPLASYEVSRPYIITLPGNYVTPALGVAPTIKIGNGPALNLYGPLNDLLNDSEMAQLRPGGKVTVFYATGFGGVFNISTPAVSSASSSVRRLSTTSGTTQGEVITATSIGDPILAYSPDPIFLYKAYADSYEAVPTLAVDGLPALGIYDSAANLLAPGFLRTGRVYILQYTPNFGGLWLVVADQPVPAAADVMRAIQGDAETRRALAELYRTISPAPARVLHWQNTFDDQADCDAVKIGNGSRDYQAGPTYNVATYQPTDGGRAFLDATANDGLWSDPNHRFPGPGFLNLLAVWNTISNGGSARAIPAINNITNMLLTLQIRLINFLLPAGCHIVLHFQKNDATIANGGTGKAVNFFYYQTLEQALGYRTYGYGWPEGVDRVVADTGLKTFTFDFAPFDAFWRCLGSSDSRWSTYAAAPVARVMAANTPLLNIQLQVLYPQQDSPLSLMPKRAGGPGSQVLIYQARLDKAA